MQDFDYVVIVFYMTKMIRLTQMITAVGDVFRKQLIDHSEQFSDTMPLRAAMRLPLIDFLCIIVLENRAILADGEDSLIQCFTQISGSMLGYGHMCRIISSGLMDQRLHSGIGY